MSENENRELNTAELSEQERVRREKLAALRAAGESPYLITHFERGCTAAQLSEEFDALEGSEQVLAGRILSWRDMGKAAFLDLQDTSGRVQIYVKLDHVGAETYAKFRTWDIGDIVGVEGKVFRTHRGAVSLQAHKLTLLSKGLVPLPEKWHGLKDTDTRYRQRYLDLIVNPEVRDTFIKRSQIVREVRRFLEARGYLEVETPVLHTIAGGAAARPFITHHNTLDMDLYLRIALELHLKRLIVGGFDKVYEIGRVFRNEGIDIRHNPEFTLLELYEAYTDYNGIMELVEEMFRTVAHKVCGTGQIEYNGTPLDFDSPFARLSMTEAVRIHSGVDFSQVTTLEQARALAKEHHIEYEPRHGIGHILNLFFDEYAEKNIVQPTFIVEYPVEISPFAKRDPNKPEMTERFELFIMGREYGNAFSELNDPEDQRQRFLDQMKQRELGDEEAGIIDEDFVRALEYGMPPTGGLGIGIDRMVMLFTDSYSIRDVLLFPTMKPIE